ncbi:MAG: Crp/Fnr family transcriptional regulator [Proteobacteria bacterium]|nr:Crp/Fnr family transcriptional regulator [Pseudomonadota bacterium]
MPRRNSGQQPSARRGHGPDIEAVPFSTRNGGARISLLSEAERHQLALISSVVHVKPGAHLYEARQPAGAIFNLIHGVMKTVHPLGRSRQIVTAFLFPHDLVGLSEAGRYVNSAVALTPVTAYRMPIPALERLLRRAPELEYHFLCKVCHELRESQHHAIALGRKTAASRLAMFLHMLEHRQPTEVRNGDIHLTMSRSDIADYMALSPEAISRTFRTLRRGGILAIKNRQHVSVLDRKRFDALIDNA